MSKTDNGGKLGEDQATILLKEKGYDVVNRNYRYGKCEVDIIAKRGNLIVFVEVKLRTSTKFGQPESTVLKKQQARIRKAAEQYIYATNWMGPIRFDIISILYQKETVHFEDAF